MSGNFDWAIHKAWRTLNAARSSDRGRQEDPQRWDGIEGELYRALKELHYEAERAAKDLP